jgi:predicted RNase H-like HicB family nuclease
MKKQSIKETAKSNNVVLIKDGAYYVALSRPLKISSYGKTQKEAMFAFKEVLEILTSKK